MTQAAPAPIERTSEDATLALRSLSVRRMPGFTGGASSGFDLMDLSPGINLIHGPNGSGKSTTARAIRGLLWPGHDLAKNASIAGQFAWEGSVWSIDFDAGRVGVQRDGLDAPLAALPPLPGADASDRYLLALHDLLQAENQELAKEVLRESAGGYDLAGASASLGYKAFRGRSYKERDELDKAQAKLRDVKQAQQALRESEDSLNDLQQGRAAAQAARDRAALLDQALEHARAAADEEAARRALAAYPPALAKLAGNEIEEIDKLKARIRALEESRGKQTEALRLLHAARDRCRMPEGGLPPEALRILQRRLDALQQTQTQLAADQKALAEARARERRELSAIGAAAPGEKLETLDVVTFGELAEFARRADRLKAELATAESLEEWLDTAADKSAGPKLADLQQGVSLLQQWLRVPEREVPAESPLKLWLLVVAAVGVIAAVVLAVAWGPGWIGLAVVIGALTVYALKSAKPQPPESASDPRPVIQGQYERLSLGAVKWSTTDVETAATRVATRLADAQLAQEKAQRWASMKSKLAQLERDREDLAARRAQLTARFGVAPDTDEAALSLLASAISRWQEARAAAEGAAERCKVGEAQARATLGEINAALRQLGCEAASDNAAARAMVEDLVERQSLYQKAVIDIEHQQSEFNATEKALADRQHERGEIFRRVGLAPEDEPTLRDWLRKLPQYHRDQDRLAKARGVVEDRRRVLEAHAELMEKPAEALRVERDAALREAEPMADLHQQIAVIQSQVAAAKRSHDLEAALGEVEDAKSNLRRVRDRECAAAVGQVLVDFIARQSRDQTRPPVFHKARELLGRITRGRYRLDFEPGDEPRFRAFDTTTGVGHALHELSSGTRVQLLLAVRMAFVEEAERRQGGSVALPLILDEALGNSDDQRAVAIIEAVLEICSRGRQVFYMTAQPDEVNKWQAMLRQGGAAGLPPAKVIDLAELRRVKEAGDRSPLTHRPFTPPGEVLAPGVMSYAEYGEALGVPAFDPRQEDIGGTHLWHVLDESAALHQFLSIGLSRWGQLRELADLGPTPLLTTESWDRAAASARVLEEAARAWRRGRGKPVDRAVLIASEAVTDVFLDDVAEQAELAGGDAFMLLASLRNNAVKRFRDKAIQRLEAYLLDQGYVDPSPRKTPEQIRTAALAAVQRELADGRLSPARLDQLLVKLPRE